MQCHPIENNCRHLNCFTNINTASNKQTFAFKNNKFLKYMHFTFETVARLESRKGEAKVSIEIQ